MKQKSQTIENQHFIEITEPGQSRVLLFNLKSKQMNQINFHPVECHGKTTTIFEDQGEFFFKGYSTTFYSLEEAEKAFKKNVADELNYHAREAERQEFRTFNCY